MQDKGRQLCIAARSHSAKQRQMCKNVTSILLERGTNAEGATGNSWLLPLLTSVGLNLYIYIKKKKYNTAGYLEGTAEGFVNQ